MQPKQSVLWEFEGIPEWEMPLKYKYLLFYVPSPGIYEGTRVHFDHRELSCNSDASHQGVHKRRQPDYQGMLWPDAQLSLVKPARTFVLEKEEGCRRTRPTASRFKFKLQELKGNQPLLTTFRRQRHRRPWGNAWVSRLWEPVPLLLHGHGWTRQNEDWSSAYRPHQGLLLQGQRLHIFWVSFY